MSLVAQIALVAALAWACVGVAPANAAFQGRLANGSASSTCTVSGSTACAMFYDTTLNITILNNWSIGAGTWDASAGAGSAQALAESAGFAATGLTGWVLPTGDGAQAAGALNQYLSIWNDAGGTTAALRGRFDGVLSFLYWSSTEFRPGIDAYLFDVIIEAQGAFFEDQSLLAVAVRAGDVAASVPEPQSLALVTLALGAALLAPRRRRPR